MRTSRVALTVVLFCLCARGQALAWHLEQCAWESPVTNLIKDPDCEGTAGSLASADVLDGGALPKAHALCQQHGLGDHAYVLTHHAKAYAQRSGKVVIVADYGELATQAEVFVQGSREWELTWPNGHTTWIINLSVWTPDPYTPPTPEYHSATHTEIGQATALFKYGWYDDNKLTVHDGYKPKVWYTCEGEHTSCVELPGQPLECNTVTARQVITGYLPQVNFKD